MEVKTRVYELHCDRCAHNTVCQYASEYRDTLTDCVNRAQDGHDRPFTVELRCDHFLTENLNVFRSS